MYLFTKIIQGVFITLEYYFFSLERVECHFLLKALMIEKISPT
jgi:hypothetical protein